MFAVYTREIKSYFLTPIGYVFCGMFLLASGIIFSYCTLLQQSTQSVSEYFIYMVFVFAVLLPLLTMKLLSEDRKSRTEQILLTSPVSLFGVIFGKYLAALTVYAATFFVNTFNFILLFRYGDPNFSSLLASIFGIFLLGSAFLAIGEFLSSLTENQLIAAVSAMGVNTALLLVSLISESIGVEWLRVIVKGFSVLDRFTPFLYQYIDIPSIVYYISISAIFLFLTVRVYEKRRWS